MVPTTTSITSDQVISRANANTSILMWRRSYLVCENVLLLILDILHDLICCEMSSEVFHTLGYLEHKCKVIAPHRTSRGSHTMGSDAGSWDEAAIFLIP